jgi:hypothetical protein
LLIEADKSKNGFVRYWYKHYLKFQLILARLTLKKWLSSSKENRPLSLALAKAQARVKSMQTTRAAAWQHFRQLSYFFGGHPGNQ